jgi:hypothetical protein
MQDDGTANEFVGYDAGWRLGTFDKCNGRGEMSLDFPKTPFNVGFTEGYIDAYSTNERRI